MNTPNERRSLNRQVIDRYYKLLMQRNIGAWGELWAPNGRQENPFAPKGVPNEYPDKASVLAIYQAEFKNRHDHVFTVDQIYETTDADTLVVEARGRSVIGETNRVYEQQYISLFKFSNCLIVLNRQYCNPLPFMDAWGGAFKSLLSDARNI